MKIILALVGVGARHGVPVQRSRWVTFRRARSQRGTRSADREKSAALSPLGERVDRPGVFFSRRGPGEGVV